MSNKLLYILVAVAYSAYCLGANGGTQEYVSANIFVLDNNPLRITPQNISNNALPNQNTPSYPDNIAVFIKPVAKDQTAFTVIENQTLWSTLTTNYNNKQSQKINFTTLYNAVHKKKQLLELTIDGKNYTIELTDTSVSRNSTQYDQASLWGNIPLKDTMNVLLDMHQCLDSGKTDRALTQEETFDALAKLASSALQNVKKLQKENDALKREVQEKELAINNLQQEVATKQQSPLQKNTPNAEDNSQPKTKIESLNKPIEGLQEAQRYSINFLTPYNKLKTSFAKRPYATSLGLFAAGAGLACAAWYNRSTMSNLWPYSFLKHQ